MHVTARGRDIGVHAHNKGTPVTAVHDRYKVGAVISLIVDFRVSVVLEVNVSYSHAIASN